jgi:hypothetical protein
LHRGEERAADLQDGNVADLVGAVAVDRTDQRQEQNSIVHANDGRRKLADRRLVPLDRVELGCDVGVESERHVEVEHRSPSTSKRTPRRSSTS